MWMTCLLDGQSLLLFVRSLECLPGFLTRDIAGDTVQCEKTIGLAVGSNMTLGLADAADLRSLAGAVGLAVTCLATGTALASELTLNPLVGAVRGVVTGLVAVVAKTGVSALVLGLRAVASEVTLGTAAWCISQ